MSKWPWMKFYPGDEEKETALRLVGLAAYGLWKRMMNLMHEAQPYGHLCTPGGQPITPEQLAALVGERPATVRQLLAKLEAQQVFSRTETGVIFCRRMDRDRHVSEVRSAAGSRGGNPALTRKDRENGPDLLKQTHKQNEKQTSSTIEARPQKSEPESEPEPPPPAEEAPQPSGAVGDTSPGGGRSVDLQEVRNRSGNGQEGSDSPSVSARIEEIAKRRVAEGKARGGLDGSRKWCRENYRGEGEVFREIHGSQAAANSAGRELLGVTLPEHLTHGAVAKILGWAERHAQEAVNILNAVRESQDAHNDPNRIPGLFAARLGDRMRAQAIADQEATGLAPV